MQAWLYEHYLWVKAGHIIAMVAWMAGMLYLPRLFVYHTGAAPKSELSETLKVMEARLLRIIMNPAMGLTWLFGLALVWGNPALLQEGWLHVKLTGVLLLSGLHGLLSRHRKAFAADANVHTAKYFRYLNEVPTVLLIVIVIMVVVRPF
jgi:protoporphyrinogen IX oxidase